MNKSDVITISQRDEDFADSFFDFSEKRKSSTDPQRIHHVDAIKRLNRLVPEHLRSHFNDLELYHMAALHRRWFSSSRKEREMNR